MKNLLFLLSFVFIAQSPVFAAPCIDSDGDGWGWDGSSSCRVGELQLHECVDTDGDGWGWNGRESCKITISTATTTSTTTTSTIRDSSPDNLYPLLSTSRNSLNVLFVGNSFLAHRPYIDGNPTSHTVFNQITEMIKVDIPNVRSRMRSIGGGTLKQHWDAGTGNRTARGELINGHYDLLVIQGRYDILESNEKANRFTDYAARFTNLAKNQGTKVVFFGLWARDTQISGNGNDTFGPGAHELYRNTAVSSNTFYAPNGLAYRDLYRQLLNTMTEQQIEEQYTVDNIHPYIPLAYMAANVTYSTIFGKQAPPMSSYAPPSLSNSDGERVRSIAWEAVKKYSFTLPQ